MTIDAHGIPVVGLGTFGLTGEAGQRAMAAANAAGYRHLDTAQSYGTEANVGRAVAGSGLTRDALFVTTKIAGGNLSRISDSIDESLGAMGMDYADLVLIHWPARDDRPPVAAYIRDLARVQDTGKARRIGVSNFTRRHLDEAIAEIGEGRLATNQFERHVFLQNNLLADHCAAHGIGVTAYMPIVGGRLEDPVLARIADKHGAQPSQIALAFLLALGSVVIPKSADPTRQKSNLAAASLRLDDDDLAELRTLDRGERHINPDIAPDWD